MKTNQQGEKKMNLTEKELQYLINGLETERTNYGLRVRKESNRLKIKNPTGWNLKWREDDQKRVDEAREHQEQISALINKLKEGK